MSDTGLPPYSPAETAPISGRRIQPRYNDLIQECRKLVMNRLSEHLTSVFALADDTLFSCAERAETNQVQTLFFDSMRDLRKQKPLIERQYHQLVAHNLDRFVAGQPAHQSAPAPSELSLVQNEEYEESLLITNMVSRVKSRCAPTLLALDQRLALVTGGQKLEEVDNPFGPQSIAQCFRQALAESSFNLRIKTILYMLFDQQLMQGLDDLYEMMNRRLIDAGVLPNLKLSPTRNPASPQRPARPTSQNTDAPPQAASTAQAGAGATPVNLNAPAPHNPAELFAGLSGLMQEHRQHTPQAPLLKDTPSIAQYAPKHATRSYSTEQLFAALDSLQQQTAENLAQHLQSPQSVKELKASLSDQLKGLTSSPNDHKLASNEADVVDLVGMLFDFILDDENLPDRCKTLLSHLHTPYLKVALQDKALFTQHEHPARRLLNSMAQAGVLYGSDEDDNGLLAKMHWLVEQVIQRHQQGTELFSQLQQEFDLHVAGLRHKIELRERRAIEAAKGRDRLLDAKRIASDAIAEILQQYAPPAVINHFLQLTWSDALVFTLLRHGLASEQWTQQLKIAQTLAWSGTALDTEDQAKLQQQRAQLLEDIRHGLEQLGGYHEDGIRRLLKDLVACQYAVQAKQADLANKISSPLPESPLGSMLGEDAKLLNNTKPSGLSSQAQAFIEELGQLEFGTWFEFSDGPRKRLLKLSWFSPTTRNYMFVDHSGQRVAIKPITVLASELEAGMTRIIRNETTQVPLMDRALGAIYRVLQKITGKTAASS